MARRDDTTKSYLLGLAALTITIFAGIGIANPGFMSFDNLNSMGFQFPEFGLMALAVLPTMISGGIDLSVVSIANLAAILAALLLKNGDYGWAAVPLALFAGTFCGALNGCLIGFLRLPAILATLGTMQLLAGLGIVITRGPAITGLPDWYTNFGNLSVFQAIPLPLIVFAVAAGALGVILRFTRFGIETRLYGANPVAARFSGVPEQKLIVAIYAASGFIAALAGLVVLARVNSANADYGGTYMLLVILINILAGVSPSGGFGTVTGIILAVLSLQFISSGLNFLSFSAFARDLFFGGLLVVVMAGRVLAGQFHLGRLLTGRTAPR
jgi:simple sugar transport system permease protein